MAKQVKPAITPVRADDYPEWYQQIIKASDLAEKSPVRGCMVIKPWGYALWENIVRGMDDMFKATGVKNAYFSLFIPLSFLEKEADHVEGFAKECAVVTYYRLVGYENRDIADEDFRDNTVDAGEIGAGHSAVAIYAVHFDANAEGRIATMQMRWEDPDTHEVTEINGDFNTWDMANDFEDTNEYYQLAVTVMQFAEVLRESPWGQETSLRTVSNYAEDVADQIRTEEVDEFADLVWQAARIS